MHNLISTFFISAGISGTGSVTVRDAAYRHTDENPELGKLGGRSILAQRLGAKQNYSDVKLNMKIPDNFRSDTFWQELAFELQTPRRSIPIIINPEISRVDSGLLSDGTIVRWAFLTGDITIAKGKPQEVTVTTVEIPSKNKSVSTVVISASGDYPPVEIAFGELEMTQEISDLILGNQQ